MSAATRTTIGNVARGLVVPLLLVVLWETMSRWSAQFAYAFVPVRDIASSFLELVRSGELLMHIGASLATALRGLVFGTLAGCAIGVAMAFFRPVDLLLNPLFQALRQVPNLALIPLIVLWFGNTEFSKLLVVSMAVGEVMVLNTYEGLHNVDRRLIEVGRALTLSRAQIFRHILIPAALPSMSTGIQHAVAFAWLATVGVELLFTVGPGLSVIMERAQMAARMDIVIVCLVFIALLGYAIHHFCQLLARRLLRWRQVGYGP
jgi:sulfonate transport system permease protein